MKLLIVDDESRTLKGLSHCLDYAQFGIEEVRTALDGLAALNTMQVFGADIVLADIGMPKMGGIELAQELRRLYPATHVVFITGHADVGYMKSAFKAQAVDYILKPINVQELRSVIEHITSTISAESQRNVYLQTLETQLYQSLPLLREKFFWGLLNNDFSDPSVIAEKMRFLRLEFSPESNYTVFVIVPDHPERSPWKTDSNLLSVAVANITQEALCAHGTGYCFEKTNNYFVCVLVLSQLPAMLAEEGSALTAEEQLEEIARGIRDVLSTHLELSVTVGIGTWCEQLSQLTSSYEIAQQAAARRFYLGTNQIILGSNIGIHQTSFAHVNFFYYTKIYTAVVNSDIPEAVGIINEIFCTIGDKDTYNRIQVVTICNQIISAVNTALMESIECSDEDATMLSRSFSLLQTCTTIDEMHHVVEMHTCQNAERVLSVSLAMSNSVANTVKDIVNKRYAESISLRTIAKDIFLSSSYLCLLFKQETGQTLSNYITNVRIENAKRLLHDKNKKLIDICFEVGFNDSHYFSRIFKKYTGESPSAFQASLSD